MDVRKLSKVEWEKVEKVIDTLCQWLSVSQSIKLQVSVEHNILGYYSRLASVLC